MIPAINSVDTLNENYQGFLEALSKSDFSGEINRDYATRLSLAVDNSIYQVVPQAVIFSRDVNDIIEIMSLAAEEPFHSIQFCPRGGGTSTNGQSLSAGIVIDCSRYMRSILELNIEEKWVRVQPGIVLDELNEFLKSYGYSFAPEISPSNRATIGGMINTDACGMGSKLIGRTSEHVEALTCVLASGYVVQSTNAIYENTELHEKILALLKPYTQLINQKFTKTPRTLNGYNLQKIPDGLNYLFCGSEGTLAVVAECRLKITPIPKYKKLIVLKYRSFGDALRAVDLTYKFKPLVVEAIDENLVDLARTDPLYFYIQSFIEEEFQITRAINLVEFVSDNEHELSQLVNQFCETVEDNQRMAGHAFGYYVAKNDREINLLWNLRKKSVGLISKRVVDSRRPIPFIEDTAVPPEHLADYISEFRSLLDRHNLVYGMYGHVDAGCVHVRPALNLQNEEDEKLLKTVMQEVVMLIQKYNGVLWGEHGQGYRSHYTETFFGKELYSVIRQIKTLFDPFNQLNPGKIATSLHSNEELVQMDGPLRGKLDKQVSLEMQMDYVDSMTCNGNGACFNYATQDVMCPSYKVTQDRIHSPKGRATLMREWLRQMSLRKVVLNPFKSQKISISNGHSKKSPDFSHEVYEAMSGCLSCKGCTGQCPLNVDIPDLKAKFLSLYHQRYPRKWRDYSIAHMEKFAYLQSRWPKFFNWLFQKKSIQAFSKRYFEVSDIPLVDTYPLQKYLSQQKAILNASRLKTLSPEKKQFSVILLQDAFTSFYEPHIVISLRDFLMTLGFTVYVEKFFPSGKPFYVKGFLTQFKKQATKNFKRLETLMKLDIPIIGIDPSVTLTYRDEYHKLLKPNKPLNILLIQEFLKSQLPFFPKTESSFGETHYLISHCTEKTMYVESEKNWQFIFNHFGMNLTCLPAGCCGMAGSYGHEIEHVTQSLKLFEMDWKKHVENYSTVLTTGFSCRSQAKRFAGITLKHPVEILNEQVKKLG